MALKLMRLRGGALRPENPDWYLDRLERESRELVDEKKRGKTLWMHPFSVGRQEHTIPTLVSALLQMAARGLFHVMSFVFETTYKDCNRRIEMMHVLIMLLAGGGARTTSDQGL